ncbi:ATP-binding protein [Streptomyces sp. B1866]|uniref:ATP-binding protein n=1 Tax=Streptomyces sp. B1866 TaxID=3075431 RepID=UPI00288DA9F1|nr:ATP-binding protein [Streptomyces sp. B1866]MDT3398826.1 ATP-binding protein [Streptomyces sp. B1866]
MISRQRRHCTVELHASPTRIGQVRRIVSAQLRYWHLPTLVDTASLGVTELLTNVHRHAEPDKHCTVEIALLLDRLTVSVLDRDPRPPRLHRPDPVSTYGRGLTLVAALSHAWGVRARDDGDGKAVWFTLATTLSPALPVAAARTAPADRAPLDPAPRPAPDLAPAGPRARTAPPRPLVAT